jgi:hypothetical protein
MLAFLIASLVATLRKFRQAGLILGVSQSIFDSFYSVDTFWKLTLDVLLFLTLPFREIWSGNTWAWWINKCSGLLRENVSRQTLKSGDRSQSQEGLQDIGFGNVFVGYVARDLNSAKESADEFQMQCFDEEHSIGTIK